ncbi:hypothetical protein GXB85_04175 [Cellulomonas sp. APG4]|uniref:hypothetical protein n=1 Tax=Cellulomonas sp. APG4 TaxID=1538656 RepID=UPI0013797E4C|nr:hypothetical protein [Cellulomonas sp. APG4]NCT90150.1 hypothetical protein [Cellulomonas sp. APG4]
MNTYHRANAHNTVRATLALLTSTGYELPDTVTAALDRLNRLESLKPREATTQTLRAAYASGTADQAELEAHAARVAAERIAIDAWSKARTDLAIALNREIEMHVADVIEHLRPEAEKALAELAWYADAGAPDTTTLLRDGKTKDAQRAAAIELHHAQLLHLRKVRREISPRQFPWERLSWAHPDKVPATKATGLALHIEAAQAGAEPWWPTWDQALRMVDQLERQDTEAAQATRQREQAVRQMAL